MHFSTLFTVVAFFAPLAINAAPLNGERDIVMYAPLALGNGTDRV